MYDTLVLYLAVFPENEIVRKNPNADPRWESWPVLPPNSILSQWVISNVKKMLDLITKADLKSTVDLSAVWTKLMAMASSFGRMGIDFRPLVAGKLTKLVEQRFLQNIQSATSRLVGSSRDIVMIGIDPASLPQFESSPDSPPVAAAELSLWDDMTVYSNGIVDALNGLRFILTPMILSTVVVSLRDSVRAILTWLATSHSNSANFSRAVRIVCTCVAPFFEKCIEFFFPSTVISNISGSSITKQQYLQFIKLDVELLAASCDGAEKIEDIVRPLLQKRTLEEIGLETVLKAKSERNSEPKFFLNDTPEETEELEKDSRLKTREEEETVEKNNVVNSITGNDHINDVAVIQSNQALDSEEQSNSAVVLTENSTNRFDKDTEREPIEDGKNDNDVSLLKPTADPELTSLPQFGDVVIPEHHIVEADKKKCQTEPAEGGEEEEGWGWEEEEAEVPEEDTSIPESKEENQLHIKGKGKSD
uniref:Conserved oligomeric Golgi complex subunit 8 n=1 Tax=Caenorhabditis tropicalis TaxID=1561998 RepID=A0A1I7TVP0_9PELO